jgi:group I intron endonuclease
MVRSRPGHRRVVRRRRTLPTAQARLRRPGSVRSFGQAVTTRFTIYCHTNKVNGKQYVGQTTSTMEWRWKGHVWKAKQPGGVRLLGAAIRKYGPEAFDHEVLEVLFATQQEADKSETEWIKRKRSRSPNGYNLAAGGGGSGHHHEDTKQRLRNVWLKRTPEEKSARMLHLSTASVDQKRRGQLRKAWSDLTSEARESRIQKMRAASVASDPKRREHLRKRWENMSVETREKFVRDRRAASAASDPIRSKKSSEWQTAQAKLRTPEQRSEIVKKAWVARRSKYGSVGVKRAKTFEEQSEASLRRWAKMSPKDRAQHGQKIEEGFRRVKEARLAARQPGLCFNLLAPRAA